MNAILRYAFHMLRVLFANSTSPGPSEREGPRSVSQNDALGRRTSLSTTRDGVAWDTTSWTYDPATGLATVKSYADDSVVSYTHTADGLPLRTTWARGEWRESAYDANRRHSGVSYSDGTPGYSITRDCLGRIVRVDEDGGRTHQYAYDEYGALLSESVSGSSPASVLSRRIDAQRRPAGYTLSVDGTNRAVVAYGYDAAGRVATLDATNGVGRALHVAYAKVSQFSAGYTVELPGGARFERRIVRDMGVPDLVRACSNLFFAAGSSVPSYVRGFEYAYDDLRRPVARNAETFAYDRAGRLATNAVSAAPGAPRDVYRYDLAGNLTATESGHGGGALSYAANALNQYTEMLGDTWAHDADGNLLGVSGPGGTVEEPFLWDGENRFRGIAGAGYMALHSYDWRNRRVSTLRGDPAPCERHSLVYDGWNIVHWREESIAGGATNMVRELDFLWGPDLSDTLQGAGGIGGLVAVSIGGQYYLPCYDAMGNVVAYLDETGASAALYAYDAFGFGTAGGSVSFPHRFSTKPYDEDLMLSDFGRRWYWPEIRRWISRDPIEEEGGENLYAFAKNTPTYRYDYLGFVADVADVSLTLARAEALHPKPKCGNCIYVFFYDREGSIGWEDDEDNNWLSHVAIQPGTTNNIVGFNPQNDDKVSIYVETRKDLALILRRCGYSNSDFSTIQSFVNSRIGASRYDGRRWFFNGPNCATFVHDALGNKGGITDGIVPINWDKDRFGIGLAPRPEELRSLLDSISGWEVIYRAADWKGSGSEEKPVSFSQK